MRFLLDTHVFLWWLSDDDRLRPSARELIANPENTVYVSAISFAEIAIKRSVGKLSTPDDLFFALAHEGFDELPFLSRHAVVLDGLPFHHRDPFDRMLIAQSIADDLTLVSYDPRLSDYDIAVTS